MNPAEGQPAGQTGVEVVTACGGRIVLAEDTPRSIYQGKTVYFCLLQCRAKFESDPLSSCLAEQPHSQGD